MNNGDHIGAREDYSVRNYDSEERAEEERRKDMTDENI